MQKITKYLCGIIQQAAKITEKSLRAVEEAEALLFGLGFKQVRVRVHGELARIEVLPDEIKRFFDGELRKTVTDKLKELGFKYVSVDLAGYKTGNMN